jgi:hypothetical protein
MLYSEYGTELDDVLFLIAEKRDPLGRGIYEQSQEKIG